VMFEGNVSPRRTIPGLRPETERVAPSVPSRK
jgi:hypothetical protein